MRAVEAHRASSERPARCFCPRSNRSQWESGESQVYRSSDRHVLPLVKAGRVCTCRTSGRCECLANGSRWPSPPLFSSEARGGRADLIVGAIRAQQSEPEKVPSLYTTPDSRRTMIWLGRPGSSASPSTGPKFELSAPRPPTPHTAPRRVAASGCAPTRLRPSRSTEPAPRPHPLSRAPASEARGRRRLRLDACRPTGRRSPEAGQPCTQETHLQSLPLPWPHRSAYKAPR